MKDLNSSNCAYVLHVACVYLSWTTPPMVAQAHSAPACMHCPSVVPSKPPPSPHMTSQARVHPASAAVAFPPPITRIIDPPLPSLPSSPRTPTHPTHLGTCRKPCNPGECATVGGSGSRDYVMRHTRIE
ncbi:BQ5605_C001g00074 [Microbotryum silenes-dioicae]|uniref:BQ5605_C001g00074 protein n=1 Tax=Microbotryum silenes-dioicae TaxID=796604 RepID=A0A2X0MWP6_9BASI|nr:BQ5605_C001g00074 [Microbotryum silenes-dioicae]